MDTECPALVCGTVVNYSDVPVKVSDDFDCSDAPDAGCGAIDEISNGERSRIKDIDGYYIPPSCEYTYSRYFASLIGAGSNGTEAGDVPTYTERGRGWVKINDNDDVYIQEVRC